MKQIFINLPVTNLQKSKTFYSKLGFEEYPLFTGVSQICVSWCQQIFVMLQSKEFFNLGNDKSIADTTKNLSATFTLPVESIDKLNEIIENGLKAGGKVPIKNIKEVFMQVRSIEDLDGHIWSIIYLDIDKFKELKNK